MREHLHLHEQIAEPANSAAQHDSTASTPTTGEVSRKDLSRKIQNTEKEAIIQALLQTNGNKAKAARLLNIDRSSLYYKLKKYNIRNKTTSKPYLYGIM